MLRVETGADESSNLVGVDAAGEESVRGVDVESVEGVDVLVIVGQESEDSVGVEIGDVVLLRSEESSELSWVVEVYILDVLACKEGS